MMKKRTLPSVAYNSCFEEFEQTPSEKLENLRRKRSSDDSDGQPQLYLKCRYVPELQKDSKDSDEPEP